MTSNSSTAPPPPPPTTLKLVSWNVASLPALETYINHEHGSMAAFLASLGCDVFCVQETKLNPAQVRAWLAGWRVAIFWH